VRRSIPALIATALVAGAVLTGCSSSTVAQPTACTVKSGSGSESVRVSGAFGKTPDAKVPSPLNVKKAQATTLITGDGKVVGEGGVARLVITAYDGATGAMAGQPQDGYIPITSDGLGADLARAIGCATVGSRIVAVVPPQQGQSTSSLVAVVDIKQAVPSRATGAPRTGTPGFPTVVLAPNGQPGIVIGSRDEPTKVKSAVLRQGGGAVAKKSDTLIVQTQTVSWSDPSTASGTWESGSPTGQTLSDGSALSKELIGQKVGSQVIVLLPKSASGSGSAAVTVVDILGRIAGSAAQ
jgi:hypothetical protein